MNRSCALAIMTKAPRSGKVKTRLVPPLTLGEAAILSECFLKDTARAITEVTGPHGAQAVAVYTPSDQADLYVEILPPGFLQIPQRGEMFGERLVFALEDLFQLGFDSVCLIDSDSPTVPSTVYAEAVATLNNASESVVLGPSEDGGYYLIGMKQLHRALFENIEWSSRHVLGETVEQARRSGLNVRYLPRWYDVDDEVGLHRLCDELFGRKENLKAGYPAPITRKYLADLFAREGPGRIWPKALKNEAG